MPGLSGKKATPKKGFNWAKSMKKHSNPSNMMDPAVASPDFSSDYSHLVLMLPPRD